MKKVTHFQNSNFKHKTTRLEITRNLVTYTKKFYVRENAAVNLSKIYFLKKAKKTCKPNNRDFESRLNEIFRSSRPKVFYKNMFLEISQLH